MTTYSYREAVAKSEVRGGVPEAYSGVEKPGQK